MPSQKTIEEIIKKIDEIDQKIDEITKGVALKIGSIARIASQALINWNIKFDAHPQIIRALEDKSIEEYEKEWSMVNKVVYHAIHKAINDSNLSEGNHQLNNEISKMAKEIILRKIKKGKRVVMADIGAGTGDTSGTIIHRLIMDGVKREMLKNLEIYFVEPSDESIIQLGKLMRESYPEVKHQRIIATDYFHMPFLKKESFDIIVSNAVFHHHSFPTYLHLLHNALKKDGFLIIGDWYTEIWYEPKNVAYIMKEGLSMHEEKVNQFINLFENLSWSKIVEYWNNKSEEEKRRNEGMLLYIKNLARRLEEEKCCIEKEKEGEKNIYGLETKVELNLLEAHEKYEDRLEKMKKAGFETTAEKIKRRYKWLEKTPTEKEVVAPKFAMVTMACKK